jgi:hypothetical protein
VRRDVILCAIAIATSAGAARAQAPLTVVIVADATAAPVVERIEGQLADLPVVLVRADADTTATHATDLGRANAIARAHVADAVVWFGRDGEAWIVSVADARGGRILVREVGADGAMSASAALEAAAMVVRTAVRGLAAGGEIGVAASPPPPPPVDEPAVVAPPPIASRTTTQPFAALGWIAALDGDAAAGHHGLVARLGVARRRWRGAATVAYLPPTRRASALAAVELDRQELSGTVAFAIRDRRRWRFDVALGVGAVRFGRVTTAATAPLRPTDDRATWSLVATPSLELARAVGRGAWIELAAGVSVLGSRPTFGVDGGAGFVTVAPLARFEPSLSLRVVVGGG